MKKSRFPSTVQATSADFDSIHDNTLAAFLDLQQAISGSTSGVLMENKPPTDAGGGVANIPAQYVAVGGQFVQYAGGTTSIPAGATVGLYFLVDLPDDPAVSRSFLNPGPPPAVGTGNFVMSQTPTVTLFVQNPDGAAPAPTGTELGYVKLATVTEAAGTLTITHNPTSALWSPPGGAAANHAASHITGGSDAIQKATPAQDGLAAKEDVTTAQAAVTDVTSATSFLVRSISGDNTVTPASKSAALELRVHSEMLEAVDEGGQQKLGLKYAPAVGLAGSSNQPARRDHKHDFNTSAFVVGKAEITVTSGMMNTAVGVTAPAGVAAITDVRFYWRPPGATNYPLIQANRSVGVVAGVAVSVGVQAMVTASNTIKATFGQAITSLGSDELADATAAASGSWSSYSGSSGGMPTSGTLVVYIYGVRSGVAVLS